MVNELPKRKDSLQNPDGFPNIIESPIVQDLGKYKNVFYKLSQVTTDWEGYKAHLKKTKPEFKPKVLLVGHDMSEIENITLMALGGVVRDMNGEPVYLLLCPQNMNLAYDNNYSKTYNWTGWGLDGSELLKFNLNQKLLNVNHDIINIYLQQMREMTNRI